MSPIDRPNPPGTESPELTEQKMHYLKNRSDKRLNGEPNTDAEERTENDLVHAARVLLKEIGEQFSGEEFTMDDLNEAGLLTVDAEQGVDIGAHTKDALQKLLTLGFIEKRAGKMFITPEGEDDMDADNGI